MVEAAGLALAALSDVYMRSKSSLICGWVALLKATWRSTRPGLMRASSSFSGLLVVMTRTLPSWDATPSMAFKRPDSEIPFFFSSSLASFAFLRAFAKLATLIESEEVFWAGLAVKDSLSASARISPAESMSSRRTTQRRGSDVKSWPRSSSVRVGSRRLIT